MTVGRKITELTAQQVEQLQAFRAEWFEVGICTERADRPKAEAAILAMRDEIGVANKRPTVIWCASPATCILADTLLKGRQSLRQSLGQSLRQSLEQSLEQSLGQSLSECWWGQHEAYWIAFYLFCRDILGVKYEAEASRHLDLWRDIAQSCGWWWCFENYVVVSERPTIVRMNTDERLHSDIGPALAFADGWNVYALNGVRVPAQLVDTPAEDLDAGWLMREKNAEVRRELVRKIGIEKICKDLHAVVIDSMGEYELLALDLGDGRRRPYLKMKNPSIGVYHIEGVHPECHTVCDALNWRNHLTPAMIDEVNGAEWSQQGDVILRPHGAKTFRSSPSTLT